MKKHIRKGRAKGVAETYIHVKYNNELQGKTLEEIENYLELNAKEWVKEFYKTPVEISLLVEEGSIKTRIVVGGVALYMMIGQYGSFRSGLDFLIKDAKNFSNYVIEQFYEHENIQIDDIIRDERRLGIPGKIKRFLKQCDKIEDTSPENHQDFITNLLQETLEIIILLEDDIDRDLFIENIPEEVSNNLPDPLPIPIGHTMNLINIRRED